MLLQRRAPPPERCDMTKHRAKQDQEWTAGEFPAGGTRPDKLGYLVRYAVLAPSRYNTQPWRFVLQGPTVLLYADRERTLPHLDPGDRELIISCGVALFYLRVALRRFGYRGVVEPFPAPHSPDLL